MQIYTLEKYKRQRRFFSWIRAYLIGAAALGIIGGGVYGIYFSPFVTDFSFDITGSDIITRQDFAGLGPSIAGFHLPLNIVLLDVAVAQSEIRSRYPQLASVTVTKDIFARSVVVRAVERAGEMIWCARETCYWVDDGGIAIDEAPDAIGLLILKVNDETKERFALGERVASQEALGVIRSFFRLLAERRMWWQSLELKSRESEEFLVVLSSGAKIRFNVRNATDDVYQAFAHTAEGLDLAKIDYFDLTVENRIYYKSR